MNGGFNGFLLDAAEFIGAWGPVRFHMEQAGPDAAARDRDALAVALRPFEKPHGVRLRGTAWLVTVLGTGRSRAAQVIPVPATPLGIGRNRGGW